MAMATPFAPTHNGSVIYAYNHGTNGYSRAQHRKAAPGRSPALGKPSHLAFGETPPEDVFDHSHSYSHSHSNSVPMAFWDGSEEQEQEKKRKQEQQEQEQERSEAEEHSWTETNDHRHSGKRDYYQSHSSNKYSSSPSETASKKKAITVRKVEEENNRSYLHNSVGTENTRSYLHSSGVAPIHSNGNIFPSRGNRLSAERNPEEHVQSLYDSSSSYTTR